MAKKQWHKPMVKELRAGSAENGGKKASDSTTNKGSKS